MNIEQLQKFNQIFQIKINETNLSKIINHFYKKITQFQKVIDSIDTKIKDELYSQIYQNRINYMINKQTQHKFISINHKNNMRQSQIHKLQYSLDNYQINQQKQFTKITQQIQKNTRKLFEINNFNQMKHQEIEQNNNDINTQIKQQKDVIEQLNKKIAQINSTSQKKQKSINDQLICIQNRMNKSIDQLYQIVKDRNHISIKGKSVFIKEQDNLLMNRSKHNNKSKDKIRKSMNCTSFNKTCDDENLYSSIHLLTEYKCLKEKVEGLQNSLYIMNQNNRRTYKRQQKNDHHDVQSGQCRNMKSSRFRPSIHANNISELHNMQESKGYIDYNNGQIKTITQKIKKIQLKNQINDENYNNLLQKILRLGNLQSKVQCKIQQAQKLRVQLSTINEINSKFKKITSLMDIQQSKYVLQKTYTKDIDEINSFIRQHTSMICKMAKKQQIKQAIVFIQNKIKQIVIILTQTYENQKIGAINKVQNIKCLTCNKDCQQPYRIKDFQQNVRNNKTSHQNRFYIDKARKETIKRLRTLQNQSQTY